MMDRKEIERTFEMLAKGQGLYGHIIATIKALPEDRQEEIWTELEAQGFEDAVDLVMYMEG